VSSFNCRTRAAASADSPEVASTPAFPVPADTGVVAGRHLWVIIVRRLPRPPRSSVSALVSEGGALSCWVDDAGYFTSRSESMNCLARASLPRPDTVAMRIEH
jgi:hypothetical protein